MVPLAFVSVFFAFDCVVAECVQYLQKLMHMICSI